MSEAGYRINYSLQRSIGAEEDDAWEEIGFGGSGGCIDPSDAAHWIGSQVDNWQWETESGQPDPDDIKRGVEEARHA